MTSTRSTPRVTALRVVPVAGRDGMLRSRAARTRLLHPATC